MSQAIAYPREVSVCYSALEDVYIIAFKDDGMFPDPVPDVPRARPHSEAWDKRWSMFTHGVCALVMGQGFYMRQLALTGWHLPEPNESNFARLLERAADRMERMANA